MTQQDQSPDDSIQAKIEARLHEFLDNLCEAAPREAESWTISILNLTKARKEGLASGADPNALAVQLLLQALKQENDKPTD